MFTGAAVRIRLLILLIAALTVGTPAVRAAWLYEPPYPGPGLLGVTIPGTDTPLRGDSAAVWVAQQFHFTTDVAVHTIGAAMTIGSDPNYAGYRIRLVTDIYNIKDTTLGSWTIHPAGANREYVDVTFPRIYLKANQTYSVIFQPGDPMVYGGLALVWPYQGQYNGQYRIQMTADNGATWWYNYYAYYPSAFRIGGNVVPEPTSFAGLALGAASVVVFHRRGRGERRGRKRGILATD